MEALDEAFGTLLDEDEVPGAMFAASRTRLSMRDAVPANRGTAAVAKAREVSVNVFQCAKREDVKGSVRGIPRSSPEAWKQASVSEWCNLPTRAK